MEGLFVAVAAFGVAWGCIAAAAAVGRHERNTMLTAFARAREGRLLVPATLHVAEPVVGLSYCSYPVRLHDAHQASGHLSVVTEARLLLRGANPLGFSFEIYPETILHKVAKLVWLDDVQVLDPPFDDAFILRTNSVPALKRVLTGPCRLLILQLHGLRNRPDTYLKLDRDQLTIVKGCRFDDERSLSQFYEICEDIFECVLGFLVAPGVVSPEASIRFLDLDEGPRLLPAASPVCQLCGEPVTRDGVACARCGTVHHRDCWDYNGGCTTYACGCTRCVPHP